MTMKWMVVVGMVLLTAQGCSDRPVPKTAKEKVSYGLGVDMAWSFKRQGVEVDLDLVIKGLKDGLKGEKLLIPEDDLRKTMVAFQGELRERRALSSKITAEQNKKTGAEFLASNKTKDGVVTLPSGLQYKILKKGTGKKPTEADTVTCHFRGMLIDGTELDSSYRTGQPATFRVKGKVIPGWSEALRLMPVGSKWQLFIPPHLAYGERGGDARIGPNATLIFELELISIR